MKMKSSTVLLLAILSVAKLGASQEATQDQLDAFETNLEHSIAHSRSLNNVDVLMDVAIAGNPEVREAQAQVDAARAKLDRVVADLRAEIFRNHEQRELVLQGLEAKLDRLRSWISAMTSP